MLAFKVIVTFSCLFSVIFERRFCSQVKNYEPNWESLDTRETPKWFDDSKIGLMIHWGVYSVPAISNEWMWFDRRIRTKRWTRLNQYLDKSFRANVTYPELASLFTAALFDPNAWAKLFKRSGVKYVVLSGKHFDGFALWPSKSSLNWNSMDIGPKRDLYGELGKAVKKVGLRYGVYYSIFEWYNPLFQRDLKNNYTTNYYIEGKVKPELTELVTKYKPDIIRSTDGWLTQKYCKSTEFLAWLYNKSPVKDSVVVNDRWGMGTMCKHGGVIRCSGRHQPNSKYPRKWETAVSIDRTSWGYNRLSHSNRYLSIKQILRALINVVSGGGNIIFNVGPTQDGRIPPIMEERLLQLGDWLQINGKAIYNTEQWKRKQDSKTDGVYYTKQKKNNTVFAMVTKRVKYGILRLTSVRDLKLKSVSLLTRKGEIPLRWTQTKSILVVKLKWTRDTKWFPVVRLTGFDEVQNAKNRTQKFFNALDYSYRHLGFSNYQNMI